MVACGGGSSSSSSSGTEGGEINGTVTSFPDYLDPQLSYTVEGWEGLWNVYVPLLTYQHGNGDETTKVVPGLAESLPTISPDGKTYTLTLRKGMKYSDGTPIVASDFPYAIQRLFKLDSGGAPFFENIVGAEDYANGKANSISGIQADDKTGKITIQLLQPSGTFNNELGLMFAAPVPKSTPLDKDQTNTPPPASGPLMITNVDAPNSYTEERNPQFKTVQAAGASDVPDAHVDKITVTQNKNQSAQATGIEQNTNDFMTDPPPADLLPQIESQYSDRFRFQDSINTYYFWFNNHDAAVQRRPRAPGGELRDRSGGAHADLRWPAASVAADPAAGHARISGVQALPGSRPEQGEGPARPGPPVRHGHHGLDGRRARPEENRRVLPGRAEPARVPHHPEDHQWRHLLHDDREPEDSGSGHRVRDWFQDYPHPNDFFEPLLSGDSIHPTNNNNYGQVSIRPLTDKTNELDTKQLNDPGVEDQYAALDKSYMEQAVWAPYGNEKLATFTSDRVNFDGVDFSLLFNLDFSSFQLKG